MSWKVLEEREQGLVAFECTVCGFIVEAEHPRDLPDCPKCAGEMEGQDGCYRPEEIYGDPARDSGPQEVVIPDEYADCNEVRCGACDGGDFMVFIRPDLSALYLVCAACGEGGIVDVPDSSVFEKAKAVVKRGVKGIIRTVKEQAKEVAQEVREGKLKKEK